MLNRSLSLAAFVLAMLAAPALPSQAQVPPTTHSQARVTAMYTTWDQYYFYAGFQVSDHNVISTNHTPNSQPQEDDDIEVFFNTGSPGSTIRTPDTYQMAVSAGSGAYFSVGDNTTIPHAELVYTYKYAATVDGTLNNSADSDVGYSIELAIPWAELGRSGPPTDGTTWGFNVISRDRASLTTPATTFYSLSPAVTTGADVQNPSDWSQIVFTTSSVAPAESVRQVICPHTALGDYPTIDGQVLSGKWPQSSLLSFGSTAIDSPAPTEAEEPNTKRSPFSAPPPTVAKMPMVAPTPPVAPAAPAQIAKGPKPEETIALPGGGSIKVVPGGIKTPEGFAPPAKQQVASAGNGLNPLTPNIPLKDQASYPVGDVDDDIAPLLGAPVPARLIMATYTLDYNGDSRKAAEQNVWDADGNSLLMDQPINGAGLWFSGLRPLWHRQQLSAMRRAGIDVAVVKLNLQDPLQSRELDALVEALKEMKSAGEDYPLVALSPAAAASQQLTSEWELHVPTEFRADATSDQISSAVSVTPGGETPAGIEARNEGKYSAASWQDALSATDGDVLIHSWNDFTRGNELAASRQYGDSYVDDERLQSIAFNGNQQWHAKYLKSYVPRTILTNTLYQVPVRVENAGTLPWRAGEQYSLCTRWYDSNGRLANDNAPRIPIGEDVLPGQTVTLSLGVAARNGYGGNLPPGSYTLVIDMVQGQDHWFTFAGDHPLQIPVQVVAVTDPVIQPLATFTGTTTPVSGASGETITGEVDVRNDGPSSWPQGLGNSDDTLGCDIEAIGPNGAFVQIGTIKGQPLSPVSVLSGEIAKPHPSIPLVDSHGHPLAPGTYVLHWFVQDSHGTALPGDYDESIVVTPTDPGVSFVLSDIPREVNTGEEATAKLAIQNLSGATWPKNTLKVGYHWYYLDGTEEQWQGGILTPIDQTLAPGQTDDTLTAQFRAPSEPGRYSLTWDVLEPNGTWSSVAAASKGNDLMQTIITVTGKGDDIPVDLQKEINSSAFNFDGQGNGFPAEMLPPDGTAEIVANPLEMVDLLGLKPGPPLYPDGYYSSHADHSIPFLYPEGANKGGMVSCQGQTVSIPGGTYRAIHVLAAASSAQAVRATFSLSGTDDTVLIAPWTAAPDADPVGYRSPIEQTSAGLVATPIMLGDYVLRGSSGQKINTITLPNDPSVKIVAITLVK